MQKGRKNAQLKMRRLKIIKLKETNENVLLIFIMVVDM